MVVYLEVNLDNEQIHNIKVDSLRIRVFSSLYLLYTYEVALHIICTNYL